MTNLRPTPIVDKNGKQTTVHKKADNAKPDSRLNVAPTVAASSGSTARADTIERLVKRFGVIQTGTGVTNENGEDAPVITVEHYADIHDVWKAIKNENENVQSKPDEYSPEVRDAFEHMATNFPDAIPSQHGELVHWRGLSFPKE
jgi:hypothetical protein